MIQTILAPVDGSPLAERALPYARSLARVLGARLVLFQAIPRPADAGDPSVNEEAELLRVTRSYLAELAARATDSLDVDTVVAVGEAAVAILAESTSRHAGLIVMSTHGRSGLGRWIYGSVADAVMRQAPVPVVLVPPSCAAGRSTERVRRILVALDGSALSEEVLGPLEDLARTMGAEVVLTRVVEPYPVAYSGPAGYAPPINTPLELAAARAYLDEIAGKLRSRGGMVRAMEKYGAAVSRISEAARDQEADLIALATHGSGGLTRLVLGSVATGVVQTADVPVLVVRPVAGRASTSEDDRVSSPVEPTDDSSRQKLHDLAVRAARDDPEAVADLVAALAGPDLLAGQVVEPELEQVTDPRFWERLVELVATGAWHGHPVDLALGDPRESAILRRRLGDLLLPGLVAEVEDAKRRALLAGVADGTPEVRVLALDLLGRRGDRSVADQVAGALASEDLAVKVQAAETLGRLGGNASVVALLRALHVEHDVLAATVTRALVRVGAEAVPDLVAALAAADDDVRWHAAEALADIRDPRALPDLLGALEDPDVAVRWHAARGLARLGEPAVVAVLHALEVRPLSPWLARGAAHVLRHGIRGERPRAVQSVEEALRHATASVEVPLRAAEALAALRPAAGASSPAIAEA